MVTLRSYTTRGPRDNSFAAFHDLDDNDGTFYGEKKGEKATKSMADGENVEMWTSTGDGAHENENNYGDDGVLMAGFLLQKHRSKQRKKFAGTNASRTMARLEIADTQRSSNGGDGTTTKKLTSTTQEKGVGKPYSITAGKHEQNATMGKYHTYNCATKEWELDDENLGKATRKDSDNNGHGGPGGHGKAKDNTNTNNTQSFSISNSQASGEKAEIVSDTDEKPGKAPRKDSGDGGHDGHGGRGKAKDNTNNESTQSFSSSNSQESGEKVEIVSGINETDDEKVEILFGWYTGPGCSHSSNTLRATSTASQKSGSGSSTDNKTLGHGGVKVRSGTKVQSGIENVSTTCASDGDTDDQGMGTGADKDSGEGGRNKSNKSIVGKNKSGKNQVESGKNQGDDSDKGQVGNASTAKRCTGVRSNGNGATANEGKNFSPQTPASTPTKNENVKTLVENHGDCGGCSEINANESSTMLVKTSKTNQKSGKSIEAKTLGHGGTQVDSCNKVLSGIENASTVRDSSGDIDDRFTGTMPDSDSWEDGSNKSWEGATNWTNNASSWALLNSDCQGWRYLPWCM
jgi:hypothetical protein